MVPAATAALSAAVTSLRGISSPPRYRSINPSLVEATVSISCSVYCRTWSWYCAGTSTSS